MPIEKGLVLVVEDEEAIVSVLRLYLTREGFSVHAVGDGARAVAEVRRLRPSAVILDIGLPGLDGFEVCRQRGGGDWTPILVVTARDDEPDRVLGLEASGPTTTSPSRSRRASCRPAQGGAAARAGSRRRQRGAARRRGAPRSHGSAGLGCRTAGRARQPPSSTCSRTCCGDPVGSSAANGSLAQVWGYNGAASRTVDVHVAQLRSSSGDHSPIRTVRGVGYAVEEPGVKGLT